MDKITCIIVDDEPLAQEMLEEYVRKLPQMELKGVFDTGLEALNFVNKSSVDLLFLDIQMPDMTGLQVAQLLKEKTQVIFTTAYHEFAVDGFELEATDYLLKPVSFERFVKAVQKVQKPSLGNSNPGYLFVKTEYRIKKINIEDILFVEGMKDYLRIVTKTEKIMTLQRFADLMGALPANVFSRVHKSFVVAIPAIDSIEKSKIQLSGYSIPIGETYREKFFDQIKATAL